ncbi:hypothetical protein DID88_009485 [Monilinia fructigena]|uniref:Actin interacting protein 3 C-terminal domain-containing protein n=1 Tax=Monilinia fructigena TaxID=38457 RepID=A0A395ISM2_9HELO|nr:hypothetical protein DID88_009485 [Monilinia fructigena]
MPRTNDGDYLSVDNFPPPPSPPKTNAALAALQRGGDLERRASRRYSAYQISKLVGASPNGVPMLPVPQNSPIPNRGRNDARESLRAVQNRDHRPGRPTSRLVQNETSPVRKPSMIIEESQEAPAKQPEELPADEVPTIKAAEDNQPLPREDSPTYGSQARQFTPEESPPLTDKEITVFLQYKTKVKKFVLADGYKDLSMARLQLAFIEKFAWNTHNNGVDLPEIYIQDPVSGVRHELEDLHDIKDRYYSEVSDRQQDAAKEMARFASAPSGSSRVSMIDTGRLNNGNNSSPTKVNGQAQLSEIQSLRRDLAVLRQTYSGFQSDIQSSMALIRTKASSVKSVAVKLLFQTLMVTRDVPMSMGGKKNLSEDSDKLVSQVDDLQDIVEDLRKDVLQWNSRRCKIFLKRERPIWTKIWEKELETVCNDREEITMQEDLAADLQDDLEKAAQTFALVEQATKEQLKDGSPSQVGTGRGLSKALNRLDPIDPATAKEGVLDEVRALQPNHENRLEAIERAEKTSTEGT